MIAVVLGAMTPSPVTELILSKVGAWTKNNDDASFTVPLVESTEFSKVSAAEKSVTGSAPSLLDISNRASNPMRSIVSCCAMTILTRAQRPWNCCCAKVARGQTAGGVEGCISPQFEGVNLGRAIESLVGAYLHTLAVLVEKIFADKKIQGR